MISPLGLIIFINQSISYVPNYVAMSVCMFDFLGICLFDFGATKTNIQRIRGLSYS